MGVGHLQVVLPVDEPRTTLDRVERLARERG
jgi:hypothetical protein